MSNSAWLRVHPLPASRALDRMVLSWYKGRFESEKPTACSAPQVVRNGVAGPSSLGGAGHLRTWSSSGMQAYCVSRGCQSLGRGWGTSCPSALGSQPAAPTHRCTGPLTRWGGSGWAWAGLAPGREIRALAYCWTAQVEAEAREWLRPHRDSEQGATCHLVSHLGSSGAWQGAMQPWERLTFLLVTALFRDLKQPHWPLCPGPSHPHQPGQTPQSILFILS